jgi:hypothetical protein
LGGGEVSALECAEDDVLNLVAGVDESDRDVGERELGS